MLKKLVYGAVFNIVNILVQVLLGLIVFREMLLHFGEADFGAWSLLFAILSHIQLCEFGLGTMISKLVPNLKKPDNNQSKTLFSTAFYSMTALFALFSVLLVITSFFLDKLSFQFESDAPLGLVVLLLGLNFLLIFYTGSVRAYLTGNFKVGSINSVRLFINLSRALLIIGLLQFGFSVLAIAVVFAIFAALEFMFLLIMALRIGLRDDLSFRACSVESFKNVVNRGIKLFFMNLNAYSRKNAAIILGGFSLGVVAIVPLRIAGRLMEIYVEIATSLNYILTPYFSGLAPNDSNALNRSFIVSIICATVLSVFIFSNISILGDWFLIVWLTDVPEYTSEILQVMAIGFCIANMQGPCISMFISKDKNNTLMGISIVEMILLIALIFPAINMYGIVGTAYALTVSMIIPKLILQPVLISRAFGIPYFRYVFAIVTPAVVTFTIVKVLYIVANSVPVENEFMSAAIFVVMQGIVLLCIVGFIYKHRKVQPV